jgi:carboxyl-terminal processing protease
MRKRALWVSLLLCLSLFVAGFVFAPAASAFTEQQKVLLQSWRLVNQSYFDDSFNHQNWWQIRQDFVKKRLPDREATYDAIEAMLATLDEPFTRLLRPEQYHNLQVSTSGELSGVGLQININPTTGNLEVVSPLAGSPAEAAGIQPHDRILAIDGVDTKELSLDEAAVRMRGAKGTSVSLMIQPEKQQQDKIREVTIIRNQISLSPVYAALDQRSPSQAIGYIRLSQFSANAASEVANAIANLQKQGAKAYILDLRNNPGGLLQAGIEIARLWLDEGTVVYTVNRQGIEDSFVAKGSALTNAPLVVLVNQGTASASEILAGALQDNNRAVLLGEKTFGKGLIQSLFELADGAGIAITVAKYETPSHKDIHRRGIIPDRVISQEPISYTQIATDVDQQYQAAIQVLAENGDKPLTQESLESS